MVCDKCENAIWYIVGSAEEIPPYLIQVCSKCGFAVKVTYELKDIKFLEQEELLKELKEEVRFNHGKGEQRIRKICELAVNKITIVIKPEV